VQVRLATAEDARAIAEIYAPIVEKSSISFELDAPSEAEMKRRIADTMPKHPWLVAEEDGAILGYAYGHTFRARAAYQWTVETSVYVADSARRRGVGRTLYRELFPMLEAQGYASIISGITLPNEASVRLHESFGMVQVALLPAVGHKFGRWHDVGYWHLRLLPLDRAPPEIRPLST
jgi:L-amino acid N-acyltransferase YncA